MAKTKTIVGEKPVIAGQVPETPPKESVIPVRQSVGTAEKPKMVLITSDTSLADVLELNRDLEVELHFDVSKFKELPDPVVSELGLGNKKRYYTSLELHRIEQKALGEIRVNTLDLIDNELERARAVRPRKGWRQTWLSPESWESMQPIGYKQVRNPTADQVRDGAAPGTENGEVRKIMRNGQTEQIACECPESVYQSIINGMAQRSRDWMKASGSAAKESIAEINERARHSRGQTVIQADDVGQ